MKLNRHLIACAMMAALASTAGTARAQDMPAEYQADLERKAEPAKAAEPEKK